MQIIQIFTKIGNKTGSEAALDELYDLIETHPNVPMDQVLARTSPEFQEYIRNGLEKVRARRAAADAARAPGSGGAPGSVMRSNASCS